MNTWKFRLLYFSYLYLFIFYDAVFEPVTFETEAPSPTIGNDVFFLGWCFSELAPLISVINCILLCIRWSFIIFFIHFQKLFIIFNRELFNIQRHSYFCCSGYNPWMSFFLWSPSEAVRLLSTWHCQESLGLRVHPSCNPGNLWDFCFYVSIIYGYGRGTVEKLVGACGNTKLSLSHRSPFLFDSVLFKSGHFCRWIHLVTPISTQNGDSLFCWRQSVLDVVSVVLTFSISSGGHVSIRSEDVVRCGLNHLCSDVLVKGNLHTNDHSVFTIRYLMLHLVLWT